MLKGLTLEMEILGIQVSLSPALNINDKVEKYIRNKINKLISLRF